MTESIMAQNNIACIDIVYSLSKDNLEDKTLNYFTILLTVSIQPISLHPVYRPAANEIISTLLR